MDLELYYQTEWIRVAKNFNRAKHKGFKDKEDFADWYINQLKANNCECHYCKTSIHDIRQLIEAGILKERKIGNGFRGKILEVDKNDDDYTKDHCVLSCYYCNNDKSYTSEKDEYREYFGTNRNIYFRKLMIKMAGNISNEYNI